MAGGWRSGLGGVGDEFEDVAVLLSAGFEDAEQGLDEAAARGALGAEAELAPDDGMAQRALLVGSTSGCSGKVQRWS